MKKFMSLMLAAAITVGGAALFNQEAVKANAEDAADNTIKTVAHYEFNSLEDLCKDSSTNGFNLTAKDTSVESDGEKGVDWGQDEDGKTYAKLRRTFYEEGSSTIRGGVLYASGVSGSKDFSDFLTGSFTFSIEFRADNIPEGMGSYYLMQTGRYNGSLGIEPWDKLTKVFVRSQAGAPDDYEDKSSDAAYSWANSSAIQLSGTTVNDGEWNTITVSGDADTNTIYVYYNGELRDTHVLNDEGAKVLFSMGELNDYTFCLNGQCNVNGGANVMFGRYDISDVRIYDTALSAANVAKISNGEEAVVEEGMVYAIEIQDVQNQLDAVDKLITDKNKMNNILAALPKTVKVRTSDGSTKKTNVVWYKASDTQIKCYLQGKGYVNSEQLSLTVDYGYTVKFIYDDTLIKVTDVKVNDEDFVPGTKTGKLGDATVTFKVEKLKSSVNVTGFEYDNMEYECDELWDEEEEYFYLEISNGAAIEILSETQQGGGSGGNTSGGNGTSNSNKKGCGSSVNTEIGLFGLLTVAAAVVFVTRRKEN